jgi:hypothetical protein
VWGSSTTLIVNVPMSSLELYTLVHETGFGESQILVATMCGRYTSQKKS